MRYKKNFKNLIIAHLIGIVLLVIPLLFIGADNKNILTGLLYGLGISLAIQILLYVIRPQLFNSKVDKWKESE
jgi:Na+-driven multidrug efflux pump